MLSLPHGRTLFLRTALLAGTALIPPTAAWAQAPNAAPQGGQVVGGSATINQGTAGRTTINQSTDRAAIDWRSFDIGRDHTVQFQQPNSGSVALNRVMGPDPSAIAGRIQANGQIAIVNQSGVVFHRGAVVDAAGLIVSTANISNQAFMAGGRMVFDQPGRADARIENNGDITIRDTGLAALVAPQVANRGTINARLGRVVLAGAETHAIDLHGDGLLSLEILSPVRTRPTDGEALVTNTGTITASGGTVQLTAAAVDGIVQDLVRAGGRIAADTDPATGRTGRVVVAGTGGAVRIEGEVSVAGLAAGTRGGAVEILGDRTWIAPGAVVNASGAAGGGRVAIGTTQPGAARPRLARRTGIAEGATVRADATVRGDGGRVIVNSREYTAHAGEISTQGGPQGGNGGFVEVSGQAGLAITGAVRVNAGLGGLAGTFLIDPTNLTIVADSDPSVNVTPADIAGGVLGENNPPTGDAFLAAASVSNFAGNLVLEATNTIIVASAVDKTTGDLTLSAGRDIFVNAPLVLRAGDLLLIAERSNSGIGSQINDLVQVAAANRVTLTGSAIETGVGRIVAGTLNVTGNPTGIDLGGANQVAVLENSPAATISRLRTIGDLRVTGTIGRSSGNSFTRIDVENGSLTIVGGIQADRQFNTDANILLRASGDILASPNFIGIVGAPGTSGGGVGVRMQAAFDFTAGTVNRLAPGRIAIGGRVAGADPSSPSVATAPVDLGAGTGGITHTGNFLLATTLTLNSGGDAIIPFFPSNASGSRIDVLGPSDVAGTLVLGATPANGSSVTLNGTVSAGARMQLGVSGGDLIQAPGSVIVTPLLDAFAGNVILTGNNRIETIGSLIAESAGQLRNIQSLRVTGAFESRSARAEIDVVGGDLDLAGTASVIGDGGVRLRTTGAIRTAAGSVVESEAGFSQIVSLAAGYDFTAAAVNLLAAGRIVLGGRVGLAGGTNSIVLGAGTGGIAQTGGQLRGAELNITSGGSAAIDRPGAGTPNSLQRLTGASIAGDFVLDNGVSDLAVTGPNSAATYALRTAGDVVIRADVSAGIRASFRVGGLSVPAPIPNPTAPIAGGTVTAPLIEIAPFAQRAVQLPVSPAAVPVAGELLLNTTTLARISASTLRLGATTFDGVLGTTADGVFFPASFTFPGTLDLRAIGNVSQAGGTTVNAGRLTGAAGGAFTLANPTNVLPQIDDISAGGSLSLRTTGSQVLNGAVLSPSVSLTTGGTLAESGAGRIGGGTLALQTLGAATLGGANTLTGLTTSGIGADLMLRNTSTLLQVPVGTQVVTAGGMSIAQAGDLVVDGTVSGTTTALSATGMLRVNGNSAIARAGDLTLRSNVFALAGLLQASGVIRIDAATSATLVGRAATAGLQITSPLVTFAGLDATGALVSLFLGGGGIASGNLDAGGLSIYGGAGANLTGTIGGTPGTPAAALGQRGTASGVLLGEPLPQQDAFLFNTCPIGIAACFPVIRPPTSTSPMQATAPTPVPVLSGVANLVASPFFISDLYGPPVFVLRPPAIPDLTLRVGRDRSEEQELMPPAIRSDDF